MKHRDAPRTQYRESDERHQGEERQCERNQDDQEDDDAGNRNRPDGAALVDATADRSVVQTVDLAQH